MKKQVILTLEEYERLIKIAAISAQVVDKYSKDNTSEKDEEHVLDRKDCDPIMKDLFHKLLYMEDSVALDVKRNLPKNYLEEHEESVFYCPEDF